MKTKSIMLIAVSLGFGLIAAIGMSQVLGQKSLDATPKIEMVQVYVANKTIEIGDALKLDDNLNVKKRPVTDVPINVIRNAEELENMVAVQKIPKDVLIVNDYILDKFQAKIGQQPPEGTRAYSFKTELVDTHHNSIQAGDRVDVVGVFKYRNQPEGDVRAPSTFLKNIEVWQVNDKHYIGANKDQTDKISTITVLLTPKQCEIALLAEDIASSIRFVKTNREVVESNEEPFDLSSLIALNRNKEENGQDSEIPTKPPEESETSGATVPAEPPKTVSQSVVQEKKPEYKFKMTIYRGGQAVKYGFTDKGSLPRIIEQSAGAGNQQPVDPTVTVEKEYSGKPSQDNPGESG